MRNIPIMLCRQGSTGRGQFVVMLRQASAFVAGKGRRAHARNKNFAFLA